MKVLVTLANTPTGLFMVRRLHALGYKVTVIDSHSRSFASYSNGVSKRIIAPSLLHEPYGYAKTVLDELKRERYDFYVTCLEDGFLMANYKDIIQKYTKMVSMSYQEITRAHSKHACREYAAEAMSACR